MQRKMMRLKRLLDFAVTINFLTLCLLIVVGVSIATGHLPEQWGLNHGAPWPMVSKLLLLALVLLLTLLELLICLRCYVLLGVTIESPDETQETSK
jgi:hypothetical protein